jgi:threonine aldolase
MHRGGFFAAAGLYALDHMVERLADDHRRAKAIADGIRDIPGIEVNHPDTNQVKVSTTAGGRPAAQVVDALAQRDVLVLLRQPEVFKIMTHSEIDDAGVVAATSAIRAVLSPTPVAR